MMTPYPTPENFGVQANMVFIKTLPIGGNISSDQTVRLPVTFRRGGKYIMVMEDYDSDAMLVDLLP